LKAFLLAAGLGTRLRPLTYFAPKPLVVLGGRTIIDYALEWLRANGVGEIYVVGLYMQEVLASYLREHHPDVVFVPSKKLLGTAGQLYYARGYMDDGPALVAPSDVVTDLDVKAAADFHVRSSVDLTVVGREVETEVRFGVLDVAEGRCRRGGKSRGLDMWFQPGYTSLRGPRCAGSRRGVSTSTNSRAP
jgi:Nucleoside-diphosphate-sugar pyrophosphorylase involved in lipopolysaccharide biosynthesis/translation initiation factor 2B, gamma/epsilon subunits (eIF-2Bgamma/eIF-2Bepsilon)